MKSLLGYFAVFLFLSLPGLYRASIGYDRGSASVSSSRGLASQTKCRNVSRVSWDCSNGKHQCQRRKARPVKVCR